MRLVIVESPYAGDVERNIRYAQAAICDCLMRGEAPIASHLLYTQPGVLNDANPEHRKLGIQAGLAWARVADAAVFYMDLGWSNGMIAAADYHRMVGKTIEHRSLPGLVLPSGELRKNYAGPWRFGALQTERDMCVSCNGTGKAITGDRPCFFCEGRGYRL